MRSALGLTPWFISGFLTISLLLNSQSGFAHGVPPNGYEEFRLPWSAGTGEFRTTIGCPVGGGGDPDCTAHVGSLFYAIDFSSMNNRQPIKAIGGGYLIYVNEGSNNYGQQAIVSHAGGGSSLYGHMCSWLTFLDPNETNPSPGPGQQTLIPVLVNQGEWLGGAGNTGGVEPIPSERCSDTVPLPSSHMHFISRDSSGVALNSTLSGLTIEHLCQCDLGPEENDEPNYPHLSNNSGPGYYSDIQHEEDLREKYAELNAAPGSTYSSAAGPCNNASLWLHTCETASFGTIISQNFISEQAVPSSLTSDPEQTLAFWYVYGDFWLTYGETYEQLGHPLADRQVPCPAGAPFDCQEYQQFECGFIYYDGSVSRAIVTCGFAGLGVVVTNGLYKSLAPGAGVWETRSDYPQTGSQGTFNQNLKSFGGGKLIYKETTSGGSTFSVSTDGGYNWSLVPAAGSGYAPVDADLCADGRLWLAWYDTSGSPDKLRIYYSDDFGASISSPPVEVNLGGTAGHTNGAVSCNASDSSRIAVAVQTSSCICAAVMVTTSGGGAGTWVQRQAGDLANTYRVVWSGSRLILVNDRTNSGFRMLYSDNDGLNWTQGGSFPNASVSEKVIDVIRTTIPGLVFAFIDNSTGADQIWRSSQNGSVSSWVPVASLPSGLSAPRAFGYDPESDDLYVAWNSTSGPVSRLPNARSRNWSTVVATDWVAVPSSAGRPGYRGFTVVKE